MTFLMKEQRKLRSHKKDEEIDEELIEYSNKRVEMFDNKNYMSDKMD